MMLDLGKRQDFAEQRPCKSCGRWIRWGTGENITRQLLCWDCTQAVREGTMKAPASTVVRRRFRSTNPRQRQ